ncbi:MAG: sugar phosphate isomerase/epimerase family protein, partial [Planctomycetota bacterium]
MSRPITLFTGQWADLPLTDMAQKTRSFGYDGIELACWGDHFEVDRALAESDYCARKRELLQNHGLGCWAISSHLVGQAVCDVIDQRHKAILPPSVWGDGSPAGVNNRAIEELKRTARAAEKFGVKVINGFTGSSIWPLLYSFPPVSPQMIDDGFKLFADRWNPIL